MAEEYTTGEDVSCHSTLGLSLNERHWLGRWGGPFLWTAKWLLGLGKVEDIHRRASNGEDHRSFVDRALAEMQIRYDVAAEDMARIPRHGPVLVVANHPFGAVEFEQFFSIFGQGRLDGFGEVYARSLRPELSDSAKRYWDRNVRLFAGGGRRRSFYFHGTTGYLAWLMNLYIDQVARLREVVDALLTAASPEEQRRIYEGQLHEAVWRPLVRWSLRRDTTLSLLGVPRSQRRQIDQEYAGGIAQFIEDCHVHPRRPANALSPRAPAGPWRH